MPTTLQPAPEPTPQAVRFVTNGWKWQPVAQQPTRAVNGTLHFADFPHFTPNKTPEEILREGCFGGGYFWPFRSRKLNLVRQFAGEEWVEIPSEWLLGLDEPRYVSGEGNTGYVARINKFGVSCEQSIDEWLAAGWFQWYSRFFQGRRIPDDRRQIEKWTRRAGSFGIWRQMLFRQYEQTKITRVTADFHDKFLLQTCHHWAYEVSQHELDTFWLSKNMDIISRHPEPGPQSESESATTYKPMRRHSI